MTSAPGNLRADYVLPSSDLRIWDSGVFWPVRSDPLYRLTGEFNVQVPFGFPSRGPPLGLGGRQGAGRQLAGTLTRAMADIVDPRIEEYAVAHSTPEPALFADLAAETRTSTSAPNMMVGTLEGRFLSFLVTMLRPQLVLEIGTFTGYSALSMAEALPPGGRIVTCDISEEHVAIARRHIDASPHRDQIDIRVGPAIDTLKSLDGPFDLAFIDADKTGYLAYYEAIVPMLAPGGVIAVDNVLWSGRVLDGAGCSSDDDRRVDARTARVQRPCRGRRAGGVRDAAAARRRHAGSAPGGLSAARPTAGGGAGRAARAAGSGLS